MNVSGHNTIDASKRAGQRRVLVADDDKAVRALYVLVLKRAGYAVEVVDDGQAAWEALEQAHYDLLITDNSMPRLTGRELVRNLRGAQVTVPVIMASGTFCADDLEPEELKAYEAVLTKPLSISDLMTSVEQVLQKDGGVS